MINIIPLKCTFRPVSNYSLCFFLQNCGLDAMENNAKLDKSPMRNKLQVMAKADRIM